MWLTTTSLTTRMRIIVRIRLRANRLGRSIADTRCRQRLIERDLAKAARPLFGWFDGYWCGRFDGFGFGVEMHDFGLAYLVVGDWGLGIGDWGWRCI